MSSLLLDRIDSVPLAADNFSSEFQSWLTVLVDSLNSVINTLEGLAINPIVVSGTTQDALTGSTYIIGNVGITTITLPATANPGDIIGITGNGAGGWILATNGAQTINVAASSASTSVGSAERYDSITVQCVVADTTWVAIAGETTGYIFV